jgi:hypothetical protein
MNLLFQEVNPASLGCPPTPFPSPFYLKVMIGRCGGENASCHLLYSQPEASGPWQADLQVQDPSGKKGYRISERLVTFTTAGLQVAGGLARQSGMQPQIHMLLPLSACG